MIGNLSNAQVIGGVVVTIGADLSSLRAGEREAKRIASDIERQPITAKVRYLIDKPTAAQLALPGPVTVPLLFDMRPAMAQLAQLRSAMTLQIAGPTMGTGGMRALPGPVAPMMLGGPAAPAMLTGPRAPLMLPGPAAAGWGNVAAPSIGMVDGTVVSAHTIGAPGGSRRPPSINLGGGGSSRPVPPSINLGPAGTATGAGTTAADIAAAKADHDAWVSSMKADIKGGAIGASGGGATIGGGVSATDAAIGAAGAKTAGMRMPTMRTVAGVGAFIYGLSEGSQFLADATDPMAAPGSAPRGLFGRTITGVDSLIGSPGQNLYEAQKNIARSRGTAPAGDVFVRASNWIGSKTDGIWGLSLIGTNTETFAESEAAARDEKQVASRNAQRLQRIARQEARKPAMQAGVFAMEDALADASANPNDVGFIQAQRITSRFEKSMIGKQWGNIDRDYLAGLKAQEQQAFAVGFAGISRQQAIGGIENNAMIRSADIGIMQARGDSSGAARAQIIGGRNDTVAVLEEELKALDRTGSKDDFTRGEIAKKIEAVKTAAAKQLEAVGIELDRQQQEITAGSGSRIQVIGMRSSGNVFGAQQAEIAESYRGQIKAATERFGAGSDAVRALTAERDAMLGANQQQRDKDTGRGIMIAEAETAASRLRIVGQGLDAELKLYDANARAKLDLMKGQDAKLIAAEREALLARRDEIVAAGTRQENLFGIGIATRQAVAGTDPRMGQLRGVIQTIGAMQSELEGVTDPEKRRLVGQTQMMELGAMRQMINRPADYGFQGDRLRDGRGIGGNDAEMVRIWNLIEAHMREVARNTGNKGLSN